MLLEGQHLLFALTLASTTQHKDLSVHAGNGQVRQHCWCVSVRLSNHECVMSKVLVLRLPVLQAASPMQQGSANCCQAAPSGGCSSWQPCLYVYVKEAADAPDPCSARPLC